MASPHFHNRLHSHRYASVISSLDSVLEVTEDDFDELTFDGLGFDQSKKPLKKDPSAIFREIMENTVKQGSTPSNSPLRSRRYTSKPHKIAVEPMPEASSPGRAVGVNDTSPSFLLNAQPVNLQAHQPQAQEQMQPEPLDVLQLPMKEGRTRRETSSPYRSDRANSSFCR